MSKPQSGFTDDMRKWIRMVVRNASRPEIFKEVFGVDVHALSAQEANKYDVRLSRWRDHPDYHKEWVMAFKESWGPIMAKAMAVVDEGLDDSTLPWRKTQHANMALAYGTKMLVGEEERTVHVQIEGMPDIGSPDS